MRSQDRTTRINDLRSDFIRLLEFHEKSFKDIENKSRYWITFSLPTSISLFGLLLQQYRQLQPAFIAAASACTLSLLMAISALVFVNSTARIESGVLVPPKRDPRLVSEAVRSKKTWRELEDARVEHLLVAISNNESANEVKSKRLLRGQVLLFGVTPLATILAAGITLIYTASLPWAPSAIAERYSDGSSAGAALIWATLGFWSSISSTTVIFLYRHHRLNIKKYCK